MSKKVVWVLVLAAVAWGAYRWYVKRTVPPEGDRGGGGITPPGGGTAVV